MHSLPDLLAIAKILMEAVQAADTVRRKIAKWKEKNPNKFR